MSSRRNSDRVMNRRILRAAALILPAWSVACAYHMPTSPSDPLPTPSLAPATIRVTASSRTDQKIDVTATVLSSDGHFVGNVTLAFSIDAGTISPTSAVTDANGSARALASTPSATTLHVSGAGLSTQSPLPASVPTQVTDAVVLNLPGSGTTGTAVSMFVSSTGSGPWSWTFGDGSTTQTSGFQTSHTYGRSGAYTVSVAGPNGASSTGTITINDAAPTPPTPTPSLSAAIECTAAAHGSPTGCHATMTAADGSSLTANISSVQWDWGDGQVTTTTNGTSGAVAMHSYVVAGTFVVNAKVTTTGGDVATAQTTVKIS